VWFYGPPKGLTTSKFLVQRLMELERPLFVPNAENVQKSFEMKRATLPYVAIQGHPNQWDDARFEAFKKAVLYLRDQGCRFVTPSEFLKEQSGKSAQ
jgi:peptidoglycan/xylan/chitin deacetylase (PgdA/CDA1 family)